MNCSPAWSAGSPVAKPAESRVLEGLCRDGAIMFGGGRRTPPAPPVALPVLRGGTAPDAVHLVVGQRELQAFSPDPATCADNFGPCDLLLGRTGRRDGEEQVGVGIQASTCCPPVHGGPGRGHVMSS